MQRFRMADNLGALEILEAALPVADDPIPMLALAGLAGLRARQPKRAIPHLQALLARVPDDQATRANLANAYVETGQSDQAMALVAGSPVSALARIEGYIHQQNNALDAAAAAYRRAIAGDSNDLSSWNNLGNVLTELGDVEGAITAFEHAISIAPADVPIYVNLAGALSSVERHEAQLKVLQDAHKLAPNDPKLLTELGLAHVANDQHDAAIGHLVHAVERSASFGDPHIELGMIYESLNRVAELTALTEAADVEGAPPEIAFLQAWVAQREGRFDDAAALAARIPETVHPMRRFHLIGGIEERRGDVDAAFAAFSKMNAEAIQLSPKLSGPSYREQVEARLAKHSPAWAAGWVQHAPVDDGFRDPIFLVGFPRSGTTLLDTMLMGSPELSVLEERPMMARTASLLRNGEDLPDLSAERIAELRAAYFASARDWGWDSSRWLVDKHPLNMERVLTIHRLFPNARFILAERHPYDVVLSCFMANFQMNLAMRSFTSLDEAARTYDAVFRAWERGGDLMPVAAHPIRYERLVADSSAELSPLVDWLGLDWDDRLLDHQQTARERGRVRTASYSQIGEKLYSRATDRWRRYAEHLRPIMPILRPWAERMGYEAD